MRVNEERISLLPDKDVIQAREKAERELALVVDSAKVSLECVQKNNQSKENISGQLGIVKNQCLVNEQDSASKQRQWKSDLDASPFVTTDAFLAAVLEPQERESLLAMKESLKQR